MVFEGVQYTDVKGHAKSKLAAPQLDELRAAVEESRYFDLRDSYTSDAECPAFITDQATVVLSIKLGTSEKTINHYLGCHEKDGRFKVYPRQLSDLENQIDKIAQTNRWIGTRVVEE